MEMISITMSLCKLRNQLLRPVNSLRFASGVVENHRLQLRVKVLGSE
jgi:hypothetical protein